ncbi:phosphotriesterase family protein [Patulibacter defluvii]|uniref:phosphotriesterase family protein n=1 Tax=Patulibacter defluvii TaxID=3095358 RepID=UPI002A762A91|nr:phosphotriesterase [Patulibacter sp. DM4]
MIETVLGPIAPDELGPTSMHEHLVSDARVLHSPARDETPPGTTVSIETLGFLRWNLLGLEDNLVLDDPDLAVRELGHAAELGQRAVVDLTSWGLGADPRRLPEIARRSGMHVVAGVGMYLDRPHPSWVAGLDDDALAARFVAALEDELEDAGFRAGIVGIVGTSEPITPSESRVLRATAAAAGATGAPLTIRLDPAARRGPEVLEAVLAAGCPAQQVIFGNVDEFLDAGYLGELAAAGATLEWCFGNEAYYRDGYKDPTDAERLDLFVAMLAADPALVDRCVMGCSVWTKTQLRAYGGMGYDHLLRRIVPELRRRGVEQAAIDRMLVVNPARLLDR